MDEVETVIVEGEAGAPEGAPTVEPTTDEVAKMYKDLGIKAPAPTGKAKGRPKSTDVRDKDVQDRDDGDSKPGRKDEKPSEDKSKDAPDSDKDGASGDDSDPKGKKVGEDSGKVSDKSKEADGGVRKTEPAAEEDPKPGSEDDSKQGADRAGQGSDKSEDETEEGKDAEGKRPGKSNPEVEKRFQKLTAEIKARDELIAKQAEDLRETQRKQVESKIAQEDPEYTIDDFRKVRDEENNILELDQNQAELAWRRWKDGYDGRKAEREAKISHERAVEEQRAEATRAVMESSVKAYDTLNEILDIYPQLQKGDQFDQEFSDLVMPLIKDAVIYQVGTEPGNKDNYQPVIIGLKIDPKKILEAMDTIRNSKRTLPLNGTSDNVEVRSNVSVPHGRSSDPTVNAANELYKELGIDKRI